MEYFQGRHQDKTGRITGIVAAGFGLASVYIAPLTTWLLAFGNALGRIAAGVMSGKIGRKKTLGIIFISLMCAGVMLLAGACLIAMVKDEKDELRRALAASKSKKPLAANAAII